MAVKFKYKGKIERIIYQKDEWSVVSMYLLKDADLTPLENKANETSISVTGITNPVVGVEYEFNAEISRTKYGLSYKVQEYKVALDADRYFITFLANYVKGIGGMKTATAIYDKFGSNTLKVIKETPAELLKIKGISVTRMTKIVRFFEENFKSLAVCKEIHDLTAGQITPNKALKIYKKFGDKSTEVLTKNPYELIDIDGFGFLTVDKIALSLGIQENSIFRVKAGITYALKSAGEEEGHTFLSFDELQRKITELLLPLSKLEKEYEKQITEIIKLGMEEKDFKSALEDIKEDDKLSYTTVSKYIDKLMVLVDTAIDGIKQLVREGKVIIEKERLYTAIYYRTEEEASSIIARMIGSKPFNYRDLSKIERSLETFESKNGYMLDEEQINAIYNSLNNRLSVITGGAGRGKTTILKMVLEGWTGEVNLCAPTGRASQRMEETTGIHASTIHRAIYDYSEGRKIKHFNPGSLVVVDESSMINLMLAKDLLVAAQDSQLIFVGDANQLPPIGAGNFFAQLLNTPQVSISRLDKAHRNMGSINTNADLINTGKKVRNFVFDSLSSYIKIDDNEEIQKNVTEAWIKARETYRIEEIRILSPVKTRGNGCVNKLNEIIREIENKETYQNRIEGSKYRIGDRVMQTTNEYKADFIVFKPDGKRVLKEGPLFNGETGTIVADYPESEAFELLTDQGAHILYYKEDEKNLDFAYATTVHKSQGSEYACAIMVCTTEAYVMLKRNLLYTGVTRAKKKLIMIGNDYSINKAVSTTDYKNIHCSLPERIAFKCYAYAS